VLKLTDLYLHHQDFASFDRAVPGEMVAVYGDYIQFPIIGVPLTMAYNLIEFNDSDPNIVRHCHHAIALTRSVTY
jgi:hypothetical protein